MNSKDLLPMHRFSWHDFSHVLVSKVTYVPGTGMYIYTPPSAVFFVRVVVVFFFFFRSCYFSGGVFFVVLSYPVR